MRPLFSDAPVMQAAPSMPTQPVGSQLAAALSHPTGMPNYGPGGGSPQIPLATLMQAMNQPGSGATSANPNLAWNPDNAVGTDALQGGTANQGGVVPNWLSSLTQQQPPQPPVHGAFPGPLGVAQPAGMPGTMGMMGQIYGGG